MYKIFILSILLVLTEIGAVAQVSINADGNQPAASSMLDVTSANKGFLMPRMTFQQRDAIVSPAEGLMVFCTNCGTNGALSIFSNGSWRKLLPCMTLPPTAGTHTPSTGQIIWRWTLPAGNTGSRWSTTDNVDASMDMGSATFKTETGTQCDTTYTRYVWAYNDCGNSVPVPLSQVVYASSPATPLPDLPEIGLESITWKWHLVPDATGYKWNTTNDYSTAIIINNPALFETNTYKIENGLSCGTSYTRYVWAFNGCSNSEPLVLVKSTHPCLVCGVPITKVHLSSEGVAPVNKSVTYSTVGDIPGEEFKCWITSNLGATHQATAVDDATEESAGWYWQFDSKKGYKNDGGTVFPQWTYAYVPPYSDWESTKDPCALELGGSWRIPTRYEWHNVRTAGGWTNWNGPFNSSLKMHAAGLLSLYNGNLELRGIQGDYWSQSRVYYTDPETYEVIFWGVSLSFGSSFNYTTMDSESTGMSVRCISSMGSAPTVSTSTPTGIMPTSVISGGNVTSNGGHSVTVRGVCWSTMPNPTIADSKTTNGEGTGSFISNLTGLTVNTLYYLRAYATNSLGTSYGVQVSFTTLAYTIGMNYGGGKIFYIDGTGIHGLIAATSDLSANAKWGCNSTSIPGTSVAIGTGLANTTAIVGGCITGTIAARLCYDLVQGSYSDWYLPSKDELNQMFLNKTAIGGFSTGSYWSSSEFNSGSAWIQSFTTGAQSSDSKGNGNNVRAIRAF